MEEPGGGAADPSLKMERVGCPVPVCGAIFEIPAGRLGRNIYCLECGRRMTARPAGHSERLRARESGTGSGPGAPIERLPLAAVKRLGRSGVCRNALFLLFTEENEESIRPGWVGGGRKLPPGGS